MSSFHSRITPNDAESIWRHACDQDFLTEDSRSLIVHDLGRLQKRIENLQAAFPETTLHAIAIKANPLVEVLKFCVEHDCGLEAASIEEVHLALAANCEPQRIVFDSPAKTIEEIRFCLEKGIHLNVNEFPELGRIAAIYDTSIHLSNVGIRINPEISAGAIGQTSVGSIGSKFGVSINAQRDQIIDAFRRFEWFNGLHVHVGSQGVTLDQLCESIRQIDRLRKEIVSEIKRDIAFVDIGGGLPAIYASSGSSPSPKEYADRIKSEHPELVSDCQLITEFGRCVHAGCGVAFSRVEYVKERSSYQYEATVHLGADFLLRPVYRSNEWKHEFLLLDSKGKVKKTNQSTTTLNGPLCFGGDVIARDIQIGTPEPGDWLVIRDCGAYTTSMWSRHCSRGIPGVAGFLDGQISWLRQQETSEDIVRYWSNNRV